MSRLPRWTRVLSMKPSNALQNWLRDKWFSLSHIVFQPYAWQTTLWCSRKDRSAKKERTMNCYGVMASMPSFSNFRQKGIAEFLCPPLIVMLPASSDTAQCPAACWRPFEKPCGNARGSRHPPVCWTLGPEVGGSEEFLWTQTIHI